MKKGVNGEIWYYKCKYHLEVYIYPENVKLDRFERDSSINFAANKMMLWFSWCSSRIKTLINNQTNAFEERWQVANY